MAPRLPPAASLLPGINNAGPERAVCLIFSNSLGRNAMKGGLAIHIKNMYELTAMHFVDGIPVCVAFSLFGWYF